MNSHEAYAVILDHLTDWGRHDLHPIGRKPTLEEALEASGKLYALASRQEDECPAAAKI